MLAREIADDIAQRLEKGWNSGDGAAFAEPFAADADFVAIRGDYHPGSTIAEGHQQIFDTIYAGSNVRYEVMRARELDDRVVLAHVHATLNAPGGPLAGEHSSLATMVIVRKDDDWRIAAFHNTLVAEQ